TQPRWMTIAATFTPRGGIQTSVKVRYDQPLR
ncbi:MAG: hypothetical protein FJ302_08250, partial [Planctomycetes bacterium]|nr:hypothetical protein [Planctomycetota bacterium]